MLQIALADAPGLAWCQEQVTAYHYLHHPVDVRSRPLAYLVLLEGERVGCLLFGRPESTRCYGWYGDVADTLRDPRDPKYCPLTRWQVLNLSRVWLAPTIQRGGERFIENAATFVIAQALRRVPYDYLIEKPVVFPSEPYEIRECLSYCDRSIHHGTLYRAANFRLRRTNERGIETYAIPLRRLTYAERAAILLRSKQDKRAQRLRERAAYCQLSWLKEGA